MKWKRLLIIFIFIICILVGIYWFIQIFNSPYAEIRNYTITNIDVRSDEFLMEGRMHGPALINDQICKIENNTLYIKIMLKTPSIDSKSSSKFFRFDWPLPDNIEKIFIEDERNKIMIWDIAQGYGEFNIEELWKSELQKLE